MTTFLASLPLFEKQEVPPLFFALAGVVTKKEGRRRRKGEGGGGKLGRWLSTIPLFLIEGSLLILN